MTKRKVLFANDNVSFEINSEALGTIIPKIKEVPSTVGTVPKCLIKMRRWKSCQTERIECTINVKPSMSFSDYFYQGEWYLHYIPS